VRHRRGSDLLRLNARHVSLTRDHVGGDGDDSRQPKASLQSGAAKSDSGLEQKRERSCLPFRDRHQCVRKERVVHSRRTASTPWRNAEHRRSF
jgi:hypothetical protein